MITIIIKFAVLGFLNVLFVMAIAESGPRWLLVSVLVYSAWILAAQVSVEVTRAIRESSKSR